MGLDGTYRNIGQETLRALQQAALSGKKIEAKELTAIQTAAEADGNLSSGESELLSKLKAATKDNRSVSDFQIADFDPSERAIFGGADLSITGTTARVTGLRANEAPQLRLARESMGQAARVMDMAASMSDSEFNTLYARPERYFTQQQARLQTQLGSLDKLITQLRQGKGDVSTLARLEQMKALTQTLSEIQAKIASAGQYGQTQLKGDAEGVRKLVDKALSQLAAIPATDLGEQNHARLKSSLEDYTRICSYFPTMRQRTGDSPDLAPRLNQFFMQAHHRVQEIRGPERNRPEETPDVKGALSSYMYDMQDMKVFMQHFDACEALLKQGKYTSLEAFTAAILSKLGPTSESFKTSARQFAAASWHSWQASQQQTQAETRLSQARAQIDAAEGELDLAEQAIGGSRVKIYLSQFALLQDKESGAHEAMDAAKQLRQRADQHMARYQELLGKGQGYKAEAIKYRRAAEASLRTSNHYIGLVEAGDYAKSFEKQLKELKGENAAIAGRIAGFDADVAALDRRIAGLEQRANGLRAEIGKLDGEIQIGDLRVRAHSLSKQSLAQTRQRLDQVFKDHKVPMSPLLRQYLSDPAKVPPDQVANVRAEMQRLFEANPKLAEAVAAELRRFKADFAQIRGELDQLLAQARAGKDASRIEQLQNQLRALDMFEAQTVTSWLAEQGPLINALDGARNNSQAVADAVGETVQWFQETQRRYGRGLNADPSARADLVKRFEDNLADPSMKDYADKINSTTAQYGEPLQKVPMLLVLDGTGAMMNFNAYVYRVGERFMALNPLDQRYYYGDSPETALASLAKESRVAKGTLQYHDGREVREVPMEAPPGMSTADKVATGVMIVGGIALLLLPEPTSKAGAVALFGTAAAVGASSAYMATQALFTLNDLRQNGNLGYNRQTAMAAFDFGSSLLGVAGGAGALGRIAQISRVESALAQSLGKLAPLADSRVLGTLELADTGISLAVTAEQIVDISNNKSLSDQEKAVAITQIGLFTAAPHLIAGALGHKRLKDPKQLESAHATLKDNLGTMKQFMQEPALPEVKKASRESLEKTIKDAEDFYKNTPEMKDNPEVQREGLRQVQDMREQFQRFMAGALSDGSNPRPDLTPSKPVKPVKPLPDSRTPVTAPGSGGGTPPVKPPKDPPKDPPGGPPGDGDIPPIPPKGPDGPKPEPPYKLDDKPLKELPERVDSGEGMSTDKVKADAKEMFDQIIAREGLELKRKGDDGPLWAYRPGTADKPEIRLYLREKTDGTVLELHVGKDKRTNAKPFKREMTYLASEPSLQPGKPPGSYRGELFVRARERLKSIIDTGSVQRLSNSERGPVLAALVDRTTGRVFYRTNIPDKTVPAKLHPAMQERLDKYLDDLIKHPEKKSPKDIHPPGIHAEFLAMNDALLARDPDGRLSLKDIDFSEFEFVNLRTEGNKDLNQPDEIECCSNCARLTEGAGQHSGVKTVEQETIEHELLKAKRAQQEPQKNQVPQNPQEEKPSP